jgi:hypothetical protein
MISRISELSLAGTFADNYTVCCLVIDGEPQAQ